MHQAQVTQPRDADQIGVGNRVLLSKRRIGMCSLPPVLKPVEVSVVRFSLELPKEEVQHWEPAELPAHNTPLAPR